jgi:hypothetical protein
MSVTIYPASHGANAFKPGWSYGSTPVTNAHELLARSCPKEDKKVRNDHIIQSSFEEVTSESNIYPASNGFVDTVVHAYNEHQHLEIRPDDVWFAVLGQMSIYVNEHAEE